ncbi:MAG: hypothetical protein Q9218_004188 [Villophora microphyllina]
MASSASTSAFTSDVFLIVAGSGSEEQSFYAHANVLAKSKVLEKAVTGAWKEKEQKRIVWSHWSVAAVEGFLEWMYTGDYKGAYPTPTCKTHQAAQETKTIEHPSDGVEIIASPSVLEDITAGFSTSTSGAPSIFDNAGQAPSTEAKKPFVLPLTRVQELSGPKGNRTVLKVSKAEEYDKWTGHMLWRPEELDYEKTLMTHGELYAMACQYMLDELKDLAWQRLRSVLVSIGTPVPHSPFVSNLVKVLRYIYKEIGTDVLEDGESSLRTLVSTFTAQHFTRIEGAAIDDLFSSVTDLDREIVIDVKDRIRQQMVRLEVEAAKAVESGKKRDISEVDTAYYPFAGKGKCNRCRGTGKFPCP